MCAMLGSRLLTGCTSAVLYAGAGLVSTSWSGSFTLPSSQRTPLGADGSPSSSVADSLPPCADSGGGEDWFVS